MNIMEKATYESDDVVASRSILGAVPDPYTYSTACNRSKSTITGSATMLRSCRYM